MMRLPHASAISSGRTTFPRSAHFSNSCITSVLSSGLASATAGSTHPAHRRYPSSSVTVPCGAVPASLGAIDPSPSPSPSPSLVPVTSDAIVSWSMASLRRRACSSLDLVIQSLNLSTRILCLLMSVAKMRCVTSSLNLASCAGSKCSAMPTSGSSTSSNTSPR